jgi:hypothetical protein
MRVRQPLDVDSVLPKWAEYGLPDSFNKGGLLAFTPCVRLMVRVA